MQVVNAWAGGFWDLLSFSMQMAMVVLTGHAMASAPAFKRKLAIMAGIAKTPGQAIILVTMVSALACWVNWGFGLVVGAIFAREIASRVRGVDYRLLIARCTHLHTTHLIVHRTRLIDWHRHNQTMFLYPKFHLTHFIRHLLLRNLLFKLLFDIPLKAKRTH